MEELGPLLAPESEGLDDELPDPYADEDGAFMAAGKAAVGSDTKARALQDAVECVLRKHGLIKDTEEEPEGDELADDGDSDVGAGFEDL